MTLHSTVHSEFLNLFYSEIKDKELNRKNKLNLFTLRVSNNEFVYSELVENLGNHLHYFALSRKEVKQLMDEGKIRTLVDRAKERLRDHRNMKGDKKAEGGEIGEILLYCFLESHLKAPKILTKLELKTSPQMFVNGADGVHLLKIDDKNYQLVMGESKLIADLNTGITKAFASIASLLEDGGKKKNFELQLVNSQLVKEAYDEGMYNFLKNIIIPNANEDETNIDYSFGIFLGFDIDVTDRESKLTNTEFRDCIRAKIITKVESCIEAINKQIDAAHFTGYSFYVYVIPFTDIESTRKKLIEGLL